MSGYTPLFSSIIASTIWRESKETKILWITMLAMSDARGIVEASIPGLADMAKVSLEECKESLLILSSPDEYSRTKDHDGRRIKEIDGGWQLLNHAKFREKCRNRADYMREYMQQYRKEPVNNVSHVSRSKPKLADTDSTQTQTQTKKDIPSGTSDADFWDEIKKLYTWVKVDQERAKMQAWLLTPRGKGRKLTRRFVCNWLNKIDKPMETQPEVRKFVC